MAVNPKPPLDAVALLKVIEWEGYDTSCGERACPCCGAWKYQHQRSQSIHGYACALATEIGAPMEAGVDDLGEERDLGKEDL